VLADRAAAAQLSPRKVYGSDRGTERCPAAASALGHAAAGRRSVADGYPRPLRSWAGDHRRRADPARGGIGALGWLSL